MEASLEDVCGSLTLVSLTAVIFRVKTTLRKRGRARAPQPTALGAGEQWGHLLIHVWCVGGE